MKHIKHLFLTATMLLCSLVASAYDFMVDSICYDITSMDELTVEVTKGGNYSGEVIIPATVSYNDNTYSVTSIYWIRSSSLTTITLPESVTSIGSKAFYGCSSLTDINIPASVTSIGDEAFYNCKGLTSISIPENSQLTSIGASAFSNCSSLTDINIPASVTSIGASAFYNCSSLTAINIPASVTSIGDQAFSNCKGLTSISIPENSQLTSIGASAFSNCKGLTAINIPASVTSIGEKAFSNCSSLTSITIPENSQLTSIGENAFRDTAWYSNQPAGILYVGKVVYSYRGKLPSQIEFKEGTVSVSNNAFYENSQLVAINIPASVTSIGSKAFYGCSSLTSITIPENSQLTSIGELAFYRNRQLVAINIPASVTSIGASAFYDCDGLTSISIHENSQLTSIGNAFHSCSGLKEVTLGKGLKKIASESFLSSSSIEKITIYATQPPVTDGYIFDEAVYENATLYVPQGSISKYQVMTGWSGFYNISEIEGSTPDYLTIRQADNGAVKIAVDLGRTYKVQVEPFAGWKIHSVTFNGVDMTAQLGDDNSFTTPTLTGSAVLNVAYEKAGSKVQDTQAAAIKVRGHEGTIYVDGTQQGDHIAIYTTAGTAVAEIVAEGADTRIPVAEGQLYIVQAAGKVVKIQM